VAREADVGRVHTTSLRPYATLNGTSFWHGFGATYFMSFASNSYPNANSMLSDVASSNRRELRRLWFDFNYLVRNITYASFHAVAG